ncbi:NAD(P)-dependent oxidoreductase [Massiliimalia massiliensis]|uniref:NAD(P)-dependent oxidoreductase n=1 Tax=Massiliimalia massiliensis TaxID=1852384 RepID=UPI0009873C88|nr:NAD(P)-dependent oxidoreductase [Massiliimalia massiliensis]
MRLGFVGVGKMGRGMCENLIKKGHQLYIYDVLPENMEYFSGKATLSPSSKDVFEQSEITFLSLPNSDVIERVTAEFIQSGVKGKTVIDVSTSYPESTKRLYQIFKENGGVLIDAPLLGGPDDTMAGNAPCIISGDKEEVDRVTPVIAAYADPIDYFGEIGSAHTVKLAMNFTGLMYAALSAQMFPLMEKLGIDTKNLFKVMNDGPFHNWVFDFYGKKFVNKDYHMDFALELALKDMTYVKRLYDKFNVPAFLLDGGLDLMRAAVKDGRGKHDTSEIAATMYEYLGLETGEHK